MKKKDFAISAAVLAGLGLAAPGTLAWTKKEQRVFDQSGYTMCDARMMGLGADFNTIETSAGGGADLKATLKELSNKKELVSNIAQKLMTDGNYDKANEQYVDRYIEDGRKEFFESFPTPADAKYPDWGGPELEVCPPEETYSAKDIQLIADYMNTDDLQEARAYMSSKLIEGGREAIDYDLNEAKAE
jgi:hypothetical protein